VSGKGHGSEIRQDLVGIRWTIPKPAQTCCDNPMSQKTFKIITLGCKVNQYESASLEKQLKETGWAGAGKNDKADLVVINTCIVTQRASYQSRQAIRRAIRDNPGSTAAAIGCYGQVFPDELKEIKGVDIIAGNADKFNLPQILLSNSQKGKPCVISNDFSGTREFVYTPAESLSGRARASLKIQDGCDSFCSYCIVPFARGPIRSLVPSKVIESLHDLSEAGYREAVITGIHLSKYGTDLGKDRTLKDLLKRIDNEKLPLRIRLSSLEPNEIDEEIIEIMDSRSWLCRHLHIPLQSGDDTILKRMNRKYTSTDFAGLVNRVYQKVPMAAIGLDVIVGFPGEDDSAFENTLSLINSLPVSYLHVFPFSPRKGTPAAKFSGQVHQKVIKDRAAELRELGIKKREIFHRSCIGKEFKVIVTGDDPGSEGIIEGISDNYLRVILPSSSGIKNGLLNVRITEVREADVTGEII
jgi:threonylcarbamoyladenosine tRNA methylthiotransferase MtaB